jgi:hypothetical protein
VVSTPMIQGYQTLSTLALRFPSEFTDALSTPDSVDNPLYTHSVFANISEGKVLFDLFFYF